MPEEPPFHASGPIPTALARKHLHGFEEEQRNLVQYLNRRSPSKIGILGEPRSGKTSLILAVAPQLPSPRPHLDCARIWPQTPKAYYRLVLEALEVGSPDAPPAGSPDEVYAALPLPKKGPRGALVLENADRLADLEPALLDELPILAARLPHHLVLTGRAPAIRPLVESTIELRPFSEATAGDFLRRRFAAAQIEIGDEAIDVVYEFTRGRPEALQLVGLALWQAATQEGRRRIDPADVDAAVSELVDRLPTEVVGPYASVKGLMRDILIAMCLYDLASPTEIARRLELEPKNVVVLLGRLASVHGLVERVGRGDYRVADPLLKHYVRKEWGSPILR